MEDIPEDEDQPHQVPKQGKALKTMAKLVNTRFLNQNIYTTFLQKRYGQCLNLINRSGTPDQFKLYIKSLIEKNSYRLDKSLQLLNECHIMNKLNYSYLKSISKNYYLLGKYKSSLEVAKEAHRINNNDYQIFYILGKISLALGDKDGAVSYFKMSIGKQPNEDSYLQQAKIFMANNQFIQAIDILHKCVQQCVDLSRISPQNPEAFQLLGICHSKAGKLDQAFLAFRQALQVDASNYVCLVGSGSIQLERGQIDAALQTFKKAYKTSPNSAALWNNIGVGMFKKNKLVTAYCCFKRALFLDAFRWDFHTNIALLFMKKQKFLPAFIHLQSALKLNKDPILFNLLGVCLTELKDYGNGEMALRQALKMSQSYDQAQFNLIICLKKQGNKEKARNVLNELQRKCNDERVRDKLLQIRRQLISKLD